MLTITFFVPGPLSKQHNFFFILVFLSSRASGQYYDEENYDYYSEELEEYYDEITLRPVTLRPVVIRGELLLHSNSHHFGGQVPISQLSCQMPFKSSVVGK